jgi:hypothetical protein
MELLEIVLLLYLQKKLCNILQGGFKIKLKNKSHVKRTS